MMPKMPVLETDRLIIREVSYKDIDDMYEYSCLNNVGPSAGWSPHTSKIETKLVIQSFLGKKKYDYLGVFAIVYKENNKMIGTVELHSLIPNFKAELGYAVNPDYWGMGIAGEASRALIRWGFEELNLKRIEASCFLENRQSIRVTEKLGFKFEGIKRKGYMTYNNVARDVCLYAMTDDDYFDFNY